MHHWAKFGTIFLLQWNGSYAAKQKLLVVLEQPTLVWSYSAQMMQPYLPLALALPAISIGKGQYRSRLGRFNLRAKPRPFLEVFTAMTAHFRWPIVVSGRAGLRIASQRKGVTVIQRTCKKRDKQRKPRDSPIFHRKARKSYLSHAPSASQGKRD